MLVVLFGAQTMVAENSNQPTRGTRSYTTVGAPAPDVDLYDAKGNKHRLSEFKGKYVYLDLWASWCGPCNLEIPYMKELERSLGNEMVVFVAISVDEDVDSWKAALARHKLEGNQFIASPIFPQLLKLYSIPRYMIYDKEGKLVNANAPRPSSGEIIKQILSGLK